MDIPEKLSSSDGPTSLMMITIFYSKIAQTTGTEIIYEMKYQVLVVCAVPEKMSNIKKSPRVFDRFS